MKKSIRFLWDKRKRDDEIIRIISARKATKNESKQYCCNK